MPLYICGFVVLGAALQKHLRVGALIMGWGIAELAVMINTVAVYAYCNDCFPKQQASTHAATARVFFWGLTVSRSSLCHPQGEISALINLARTLGGSYLEYHPL